MSYNEEQAPLNFIHLQKLEKATRQLQELYIYKYTNQFLNNFNSREPQINNFLSEDRDQQESMSELMGSKTQQMQGNLEFAENEEDKDNLNEEVQAQMLPKTQDKMQQKITSAIIYKKQQDLAKAGKSKGGAEQLSSKLAPQNLVSSLLSPRVNQTGGQPIIGGAQKKNQIADLVHISKFSNMLSNANQGPSPNNNSNAQQKQYQNSARIVYDQMTGECAGVGGGQAAQQFSINALFKKLKQPTNTQQKLWQIQPQYKLQKKQELQQQQDELLLEQQMRYQQQRDIRTLHFGDIIYIKYNAESGNKGATQYQDYYIIGNTNNRVECVNEQAESLNNPIAHFRRCLFRIVNPREYTGVKSIGGAGIGEDHLGGDGTKNMGRNNSIMSFNNFGGMSKSSHKLIGSTQERSTADSPKGGTGGSGKGINYSDEDDDDLHHHRKKATNRKDKNIVYGQEIVLLHVYSQMMLTVDMDKPSQQLGCVEVNLDPGNSDSCSIFQIFPTDKSRRNGDKICNSDEIIIKEARDQLFYLAVATDSNSLGGPVALMMGQAAQAAAQTSNVSGVGVSGAGKDENGMVPIPITNQANLQPNQQQLQAQPRLDVSGSERPSKFKINCYATASEDQEQSILKNSENQYVSTGEVIAMQHLETGAYLCVSEKKLNSFIKRNCKVAVPQESGAGNKDKQQQEVQEVPVLIQQLDKNRTMMPSNFEVVFELSGSSSPKGGNNSGNNNNSIENSEVGLNVSSSALWEMQRQDNFCGGPLQSRQMFRLKNLATGLFLAYDSQLSNFGSAVGKLQLTYNASSDECHFFIKKQRSSLHSQSPNLYFYDSVKVFNKEQNFFCLEQQQLQQQQQQQSSASTSVGGNGSGSSSDSQTKFTCFLSAISKGNNKKAFVFRLQPCQQRIKDFVEKTFQIYHTLLNFHFYLQSFALDKEQVVYDYSLAVHQQKVLEKEVAQASQSLDELTFLLTRDGDSREFPVSKRQRILYAQKHLELLVLLAKLIDQMVNIPAMYHHQQQQQQVRRQMPSGGSRAAGPPEKTPHYIVLKYVAVLPPKIYRILDLSCSRNAQSSQFIFQNDDFLSGQLVHFPSEVRQLLSRAAGNLSQLKRSTTAGQQQPQQQGEELTKWIKLLLKPLDDVNKRNITDQIFYAELISRSLIDPLGKGLKQYQNKCANDLFQQGQDGKAQTLLQFSLSQDKHPLISFFKENLSVTEFMAANPTLKQLQQVQSDAISQDMQKQLQQSQSQQQQMQMSGFYQQSHLG